MGVDGEDMGNVKCDNEDGKMGWVMRSEKYDLSKDSPKLKS
jgi:hypothetical protein